jgi:hypothetical protein
VVATTPGRRARPRRRRRLLILLAAAATIAGVLAVAATAFTSLETFTERTTSSSKAPEWSAPCFRHEPRPDRLLLSRCARATGVVAHVRVEGSGESAEVHFALLGRFGALIVKLGDPHALATPSVGSRVTVVGPLVRASNDMREIQAWSLR